MKQWLEKLKEKCTYKLIPDISENENKLTDKEKELAFKLINQQENRIKEQLDIFKAQDKKLKEDLKTFTPIVNITGDKNKLIEFMGVEFIAEFCTHLSIASLGSGYYIHLSHYGMGFSPTCTIGGAKNATIQAHLVSGKFVEFSVPRHVVHKVYDALCEAHKLALLNK